METKKPLPLQHLAFIYYRRKAENDGYLKDFQMTIDPMDNSTHLTATAVANGELLHWSIGPEFIETAIDQNVINAIRKMVQQAKSLSGVFEPEP